MKIRKLHLKNIGVFDDEEINFQECPAKDKAEIHILTGENGTGKTTILMALAYPFSKVSLKIGDGGLELEKRIRKVQKEVDQEFIKVCFDDNRIYESRIYFDGSFGATATFEKPKIDSEDTHSNYAVFAFSGQRQTKTERIETIKEPKDFNPLSQSLNFVKDYTQANELTINQLIANNFSKSGIEYKKGNTEKSERFEKVVKAIEQAIFEITDLQIKFDLQTEPTNLVLKLNREELDFDVLPDGLRSLISWIADLLGRVDLLKWEDDLPITEKNLILLLDEIEVHLHPAWQRKVLPIVQKLFKNAQIFVSTHSPFVVNSVDDAWVYKLKVDENGKAHCEKPIRSEDGISYQTVLSEIFGIDQEFGGKTQDDLDKFYKIIRNGKVINEKDLTDLAKSLAEQSEELNSIVQIELRQLNRKRGTNFAV